VLIHNFEQALDKLERNGANGRLLQEGIGMIKSAADMRTELRERMRGGEGTVQIRHVFEQTELKGKCRLFALITLEPNSSIGLHAHESEEEVYYILQGRAKVVDDGEERELKPGDAVLTGDGRSHSIANIGDEALELMAVILTY
jgi:mannose-6-phosphate isomerase-like protein (cupin superfamily)